jgi:4-hydroxy-3-polyprenylbenzoate decarboxylase
MDVTCITMRRKPIYLAILSQLPPSESSMMRHLGRSAAARKFLLDAGFDTVSDLDYLECGGANSFVVVKLKKRDAGEGMRALEHLATKFIGKFAIAVDEDIDIASLEHILWAVAWRVRPHVDVKSVETPLLALDPSVAPPGTSRGIANTEAPISTGLLIDATMPWDYPPISLPRKEYMERAREIWRELQLPALELRSPWYGYQLGAWTKELEDEARLAVEGRHLETGAKLKNVRKRID